MEAGSGSGYVRLGQTWHPWRISSFQDMTCMSTWTGTAQGGVNGEVQVCADAATAYSTAFPIYIEKYQFIQLQVGRSSTVKSKL